MIVRHGAGSPPPFLNDLELRCPRAFSKPKILNKFSTYVILSQTNVEEVLDRLKISEKCVAKRDFKELLMCS